MSMPQSWCGPGGRQVDVVGQSQRWTEDGRRGRGERWKRKEGRSDYDRLSMDLRHSPLLTNHPMLYWLMDPPSPACLTKLSLMNESKAAHQVLSGAKGSTFPLG